MADVENGTAKEVFLCGFACQLRLDDWMRADGGVIFCGQVCSSNVYDDEISMATWKEDTLVSASSLLSTTGLVLSKTAYILQHFSHARRNDFLSIHFHLAWNLRSIRVVE